VLIMIKTDVKVYSKALTEEDNVHYTEFRKL